MFGGRKTMRNRLNSPLPSFFAPAPEALLSAPRPGPHPLEVYDITYLHFHDNLELGVCVSGQGACQVEGVLYPFAAGDVQIIFPFQSHLSRSEGAQQSRWFWLNIDPMRLLAAWGAPGLARLERLLHTGMGLCGIIDGTRYPLIRELVARVVLSGGEQRRLSCLYALIEELAAESQALPKLSLRPSRQFVQLSPALERVQACLDEGRAPRVDELCRACALSPAAFRRAFQLAMGQPPQQYILACQMKKAQRLLLLTDTSIAQIAQDVGYQDVSGFNRQFLRAFGLPPREYRARQG